MADTITDTHRLATLVRQIDVNYYASLVAFVVLYYDYLLTFGDEVHFFWRRKANSVTILFFLNRYLSILGNIPVILQSFRSWSDKGCHDLQRFHQFFSVLIQIIVGVILMLRTYALYERNLTVAIIMAAFALIVIGVGVWAVVGKTSTIVEPFNLSFMLGCHPLISSEEGRGLAIAWGGLLLFDSVIFTLTLFKAIAIWKLGTRRLFHVLIRDGTIYYLVLAMANLSNILTFVLGEPILRGASTTFANAVSVAMISRLMLNLQNPLLFESRWHTHTHTTGMETYVGPFVTTILERDGVTTVTDSATVTNSTRNGLFVDGYWGGERGVEAEPYEHPRNALWYDRAWVSGSTPATGMRSGIGSGAATGMRSRVDEVVEEVELSPTLTGRNRV